MQDNMDTFNKILILLLKPYWGNQDIQNYFELTDSSICTKKAIKIRKQAEISGGSIAYVQCKVTVDSVMKVIGKRLETELEVYSKIANKRSFDDK